MHVPPPLLGGYNTKYEMDFDQRTGKTPSQIIPAFVYDSISF